VAQRERSRTLRELQRPNAPTGASLSFPAMEARRTPLQQPRRILRCHPGSVPQQGSRLRLHRVRAVHARRPGRRSSATTTSSPPTCRRCRTVLQEPDPFFGGQAAGRVLRRGGPRPPGDASHARLDGNAGVPDPAASPHGRPNRPLRGHRRNNFCIRFAEKLHRRLGREIAP
jgi:hypothetical protein